MSTASERKKSTFGNIVPLEKKITDPTKLKPKKVIILSGPTACGKTSLSLLLAEKLKGEIISADSMQVYRGMDIGTSKVSQEDQARIVHHLIDVRHVSEPFNVVDFYYEACQCIESITARDRTPIVVGGSGFYIHTLLYGPPQGPPSLPELRRTLEQEMEKFGSERLYERLTALDPVYAATITAHDKQKIVRGLEIITLTGEKVSKLQWNREKVASLYDFRCWFLHRPREALYPRIEERCEQMIEAGLFDELKELIKQGLNSNPSAAQAIGYRQVLDFLQTGQTEKDYKEFVKLFKQASRHYAKRQFTWFRKEPLFRWLNIEVHDMEIAMDMIIQDYQNLH